MILPFSSTYSFTSRCRWLSRLSLPTYQAQFGRTGAMEFFRNLKIGMKLMIVVLSVVAMTALLGTFSVIQLSKVNDVSNEISGNWLPSVQALGKISMSFNLTH